MVRPHRRHLTETAMHVARNLVLATLFAAAPLAYAGSAQAAGEISCRMTFELHGWSAFYKKADGTGGVGQRHRDDQGQRVVGHERHRQGLEPGRRFRQVHDFALSDCQAEKAISPRMNANKRK